MKIDGGSSEIEIYISTGGYLCMKQADWPQEENIILVHPHQFDQFKSAIEKTIATGTKEGFICP